MSNKAFFLCGLVLVSTLMTGFEVLINAEYQGSLGPWTMDTLLNTPGKKTLRWVEVQHPQDVSFNKVARQVWTSCQIFVAPCGPLSLEGVPSSACGAQLIPGLSPHSRWWQSMGSSKPTLIFTRAPWSMCQHFSSQPAHLASLPGCTVVKCCSPPLGISEIPVHVCDWTGFKINHMPLDKQIIQITQHQRNAHIELTGQFIALSVTYRT